MSESGNSQQKSNIHDPSTELGEFNLVKTKSTLIRKIRRLLVVPMVLGLILDSIFIYNNWGDGFISKTTPVVQVALAKAIETDITTPTEPDTAWCDNYKEVQKFKNPIPIVWTAKFTGCLVSCWGAHFTRLPEGTNYKYPRFAGYYPDAAKKYHWEGGGSQIPEKFLEDDAVLRIYGKWTDIGEDHPRTVFGNKCVPIVNIEKIEIIK